MLIRVDIMHVCKQVFVSIEVERVAETSEVVSGSRSVLRAYYLVFAQTV